jgi:hypothetical protein
MVDDKVEDQDYEKDLYRDEQRDPELRASAPAFLL